MKLNFEIQPTSEHATFKYNNIAKRESRGGFSGLAYGSNPTGTVEKGTFKQTNTFKASMVMETMADKDKDRFAEETIERQRFMDEKKNLAGNKDVSTFEDRTILRFDPLEGLKKNESGYATYDGGRYQSGQSDQSFMKGGEYLKGRGRFTTLERQDPYQVKLSGAIKIKQ